MRTMWCFNPYIVIDDHNYDGHQTLSKSGARGVAALSASLMGAENQVFVCLNLCFGLSKCVILCFLHFQLPQQGDR